MSAAFHENFIRFAFNRCKDMWPRMNIYEKNGKVRLGISCSNYKNCCVIETDISAFDDQDGFDVFKVPGEWWQIRTVCCPSGTNCTRRLVNCCSWLLACSIDPNWLGIGYHPAEYYTIIGTCIDRCLICGVSSNLIEPKNGMVCCTSQRCKDVVADHKDWIKVIWTLCELAEHITQDVKSYINDVVCCKHIAQVKSCWKE